jgi:hypothetical protein
MPTHRQRIAPRPAAKKTAAPAATATAAAPAAVAPNYGIQADGTSAKATLAATLDSYGLGSLTDWAWGQYLGGTPADQIMLDLRARPEYAQRFPGMAALAASGHAISEGQYIQAEQSYASQMRAYGLPAGFYDDPTDFAKLISGNVSAQEFGDRLSMAEQAAMSNPQGVELRNQLASFYGIPNAQGAATAYFIDPDRAATLVKQQFAAAQASAISNQSGFGSLTLGQAEHIAGTNTSADALSSGFASLSQMGELTHGLVGDAGDPGVSRDQMLNAAFAGDGAAQAALKNEQQRRTAVFAGGGGFAGDAKGLSGLGSAAG